MLYDLDSGFSPGCDALDEDARRGLIRAAYEADGQRLIEGHDEVHAVVEMLLDGEEDARRALELMLAAGVRRDEAISMLYYEVLSLVLIDMPLRSWLAGEDMSDEEPARAPAARQRLQWLGECYLPPSQAEWDSLPDLVDARKRDHFLIRLMNAFEPDLGDAQQGSVNHVIPLLEARIQMLPHLGPDEAMVGFEETVDDVLVMHPGVLAKEVAAALSAFFRFCATRYGMATGEACAAAFSAPSFIARFEALSQGPQALKQLDDSPGDLPEPVVRDGPKVGRNSPCPCGSGKKYKRCCGK